MTYRDILEETYSALRGNIVRTALTMLGIVIGISSVIAMIAIGEGAKVSIQNSIQSIGSNLLIVYPGAQRSFGTQVRSGGGTAKSLTLADAEAITTSVQGIKGVAPEVSGRYQIVSSGKNSNTSVVGITDVYADARNVIVETGNGISTQQVKSTAKVAVIGPTTATNLFGEDSPLGKKIRIKQIEFKVVGITKAKGGTGFQNQDDIVYIPISTAQVYLSGDTSVTSISVQATQADVMTTVQQDITDLLMNRHKITNAQNVDFSVMNQADIVATASSVTGTFTTLLSAVAAISLLVGGIGIMNMMLTAVMERTREIGLRKAIGAKKRDIVTQFLCEALALTVIGGLVGVMLGFIISWGVSATGLLTTSVSGYSVVLAFGVCAIIGVLFGYYPAVRASRLNPISALRFE